MSDAAVPDVEGEKLSAWQRWELPALSGQGALAPVDVDGYAPAQGGHLPTAATLEDIQRLAHEEGYAQGAAAAARDMQDRVQRLDAVLNAFTAPLAALDEQAEREIVQLTLLIARHIVRRELKADPGAVIATVREAMARLPVGAREVRIHLHPDDAQLVRAAFDREDGDRPWRVVDDPVLGRGDCRVTTEHSQIDAAVETRLNALIYAALGGERRDDPVKP